MSETPTKPWTEVTPSFRMWLKMGLAFLGFIVLISVVAIPLWIHWFHVIWDFWELVWE